MISTRSFGQAFNVASIMQTFCLPLTGPMRSMVPRRNRLRGFLLPVFWNVRLMEQSFFWNCWKNVISCALSTTRKIPLFMESWKGAQMSR